MSSSSRILDNRGTGRLMMEGPTTNKRETWYKSNHPTIVDGEDITATAIVNNDEILATDGEGVKADFKHHWVSQLKKLLRILHFILLRLVIDLQSIIYILQSTYNIPEFTPNISKSNKV